MIRQQWLVVGLREWGNSCCLDQLNQDSNYQLSSYDGWGIWLLAGISTSLTGLSVLVCFGTAGGGNVVSVDGCYLCLFTSEVYWYQILFVFFVSYTVIIIMIWMLCGLAQWWHANRVWTWQVETVWIIKLQLIVVLLWIPLNNKEGDNRLSLKKKWKLSIWTIMSSR